MQVNLLQALLPTGTRVGTVDKFQGQEAAVVVVSMTASSAEDVPRGMEFLYSRNRINVAVSRAKSLAIIVASPRLLEASCSKIEQMALVNTLCYAEGVRGAPEGLNMALIVEMARGFPEEPECWLRRLARKEVR